MLGLEEQGKLMNSVDAFSRLCTLADAMEVGPAISVDQPSSPRKVYNYHYQQQQQQKQQNLFIQSNSPTVKSNFTGAVPGRQHCFKLQTPEDLCGLFQPRQRPKVPRKRIDPRDTAYLQRLFDRGLHFPNRGQRELLADQLNLTPRTVQVWFQNKRQFNRNKSNNSVASGSPTAAIKSEENMMGRRHSVAACVKSDQKGPATTTGAQSPTFQIRWMQPIVVDKQGRPMTLVSSQPTPTVYVAEQLCGNDSANMPRQFSLDQRRGGIDHGIVLPLPPNLLLNAGGGMFKGGHLPTIHLEKLRRSSVS